MIKKMIALVMMLAMFTVQANASTNEVLALLTHDSNTEALKAAFDDLNYAMTVEWDQKDESFRAAEMKKFTASVTDLQAKGLSNTQLVEFAKSQVKDTKIAKDIESAFAVIQANKMSATDASKYIVDSMKNSYASGASWNGASSVGTGTLLLLIGLALIFGGSSSTSSGSVCGYHDVWVCTTYCNIYNSCYDSCGYQSQYSCY